MSTSQQSAWPTATAATAHQSGSPPAVTASAPSRYMIGLRWNEKMIEKRSRHPTVRMCSGIASTPKRSTIPFSDSSVLTRGILDLRGASRTV